MRYGGGADVHINGNLYVYVDYAFLQAISSEIDVFNYHAVGAGIGYRW